MEENMKKHRILHRILALLLLLTLAISIQVPQAKAAKSTKFNAKTAKKNLDLKYYKLDDGVLLICKNKNSYPVKLEGTISFLDTEKHVITKSKDQNHCLGAKQTCILFYKAPLDANSNYVTYASYKKSIKVSKCDYKSYSKKIVTSTNMLPSIFNLSVMNNSNKKLDVIRVSCVIYDHSGKIIGCVQKYANCYEKGSTITETISYPPVCSNPDKVKVYVDTAYQQ